MVGWFIFQEVLKIIQPPREHHRKTNAPFASLYGLKGIPISWSSKSLWNGAVQSPYLYTLHNPTTLEDLKNPEKTVSIQSFRLILDQRQKALVTPPKFNIAPEKWMVGRLLSYWEGNFLGAMLKLKSREGKHLKDMYDVFVLKP